MRYHIRHETLYSYGTEVLHSHQLLHLVPRPAPYQECAEHAIEVSVAPHQRRDGVDAFGNPVTRIELDHPHRELGIVARMDIEVHPRPQPLATDSLPWERVCAALAYQGASPGREALEACRFRCQSPYIPLKRMYVDYAHECFTPERSILAAAAALMTKLHEDLEYAPGTTTVQTPLEEVLVKRRGVCQDFAQLMIACLRSRGLAARYVSGYVRRVGQMADGASHAWVAVFAPPFGWVELDPTNDVRVGTDHVAVAWGRDFGDVSPLRGVILGGGSHELAVKVRVESASGR